MKTRIEVITNNSFETILKNMGYSQNGRMWEKEGITYKIAWLHRNSLGQLSYIDLCPLNY